MLNLSDRKWGDKLNINEENILSFINEYSIFRHYVGEFDVNKIFHSPLREDKRPSFGIFYSKKYNGKLLFKDLASDMKGSCFNFVMYLYNITYNEALSLVINDFHLQEYFYNVIPNLYTAKAKIISDKYIIKPSETSINIRIRDWKEHDKLFWNQFNISNQILQKYNVYPIDYFFINNNPIKADRFAYAFMEEKDGIRRYKIYQPFSKQNKWFSNFIEGTISGWNQMNKSSNILIITSSLKDVMSLDSLGYNSIAPQTETYSFKPHIIRELYKYYTNIYILYDYDKAGVHFAYKNKELFKMIPFFTNSIKCKDISDYIKYYNKNKAKNLIEKYI